MLKFMMKINLLILAKQVIITMLHRYIWKKEKMLVWSFLSPKIKLQTFKLVMMLHMVKIVMETAVMTFKCWTLLVTVGMVQNWIFLKVFHSLNHNVGRWFSEWASFYTDNCSLQYWFSWNNTDQGYDDTEYLHLSRRLVQSNLRYDRSFLWDFE